MCRFVSRHASSPRQRPVYAAKPTQALFTATSVVISGRRTYPWPRCTSSCASCLANPPMGMSASASATGRVANSSHQGPPLNATICLRVVGAAMEVPEGRLWTLCRIPWSPVQHRLGCQPSDIASLLVTDPSPNVTFASRALPRVGSPRIFDSPALSPQEVYMRLVGHRCIDADMQVVVVAAELTVGDRKRMRSSRQLRENTNKGIAPDLRMVSASMWCSSGSMGSKGRTRTVAVC